MNNTTDEQSHPQPNKIETGLNWLQIDSFPEVKPEKHEIESEKSDEIDEYIEFDPELFNPRPRIIREKSDKYKNNLPKLHAKTRRLCRKALVDLCRKKSIIIDKYDVRKISFRIDLKGHPMAAKLPQKKWRARKKLPILGLAYIEAVKKSDRYFLFKPPNNYCFVGGGGDFAPISDFCKIPTNFAQNLNEDFNPSSELTAKISTLNKKVFENPHDITSWIDLIEIQPQKLGENIKESLVVESQMAVLSKALARNPTSEELLLRQLYLKYNVSDNNSLREALEDIVFNFPQKIKFWVLYLQFNCADFSRLSLTNTCALYSKALVKLNSLRSSLVRASQRLEDPVGSRCMLQVYAHFSMFLLEMDFTEKLTGLMQLLLDYNFSTFSNTALEKIKPEGHKLYLEAFWDSSAPKMGESDFQGFNFFLKSRDKSEKSPNMYDFSRVRELTFIIASPSVNEEQNAEWESGLARNHPDSTHAWVCIENMRSTRHMFKSNSKEEVVDTDRVVLFEDISEFIYRLDESTRFDLLMLFLLILGVPVPLDMSSCFPDIFFDGVYLTDLSLNFPHIFYKIESILGSKSIVLKKSLSPIWMSATPQDPTILTPPDIVLLSIIRNLIAQSLSYAGFSNNQREKLSVVWLQFEIYIVLIFPTLNSDNFQNLLILGRKLLELEENRNSIVLWLMYCYILICANKPDQFYKTLNRLIKPHLTLNFTDILHSSIFVKFFVENMVLNNFITEHHRDNIVYVVSTFLSVSTKTEYFETRESDFNNGIMRLINDFHCKSPLICYNVVAAQFYLNVIVKDAYFAVEKYLMWIKFCLSKIEQAQNNGGKECKILPIFRWDFSSPFISLCRLLSEYFSILVNHPAFSSYFCHQEDSIIHECISLFPNSVLIQQWFHRSSQKSTISPVRLIFDHILLDFVKSTNSELSAWVFSIYSDIFYILRIKNICNDNCERILNSALNRVVNSFERILTHQYFRFRPVVWRLYMRVLFIFNDHETLHAVFYRSLQHVPWCKNIYMDAVLFNVLPLESVVDMIFTKGIRLRIPLEEFELIRS